MANMAKMNELRYQDLRYKNIIEGGGIIKNDKISYKYEDVETFFDCFAALDDSNSKEIFPITIKNKNKTYIYTGKYVDINVLKGKCIFLSNREQNRIKTQMYLDCANTFNYRPTIICIGSGRGGDILKMNRYSKVLFVEPNLDNLKELKRRLTHKENKKKIKYKWKILNTVGQQSSEIIKEAKTFFKKDPDVLSFMLSLSFFNLEDKEQLEGIKYMANACKRFMYLTIDKELLLKNYNKDQRFEFLKVNLEKVDKELTIDDDVKKSYVDYLFTINIPNSIVTNQREYLVDSKYLAQSTGGKILFEGSTNSEKFLTQDELWLTKLYYYYIIDVSTQQSNKNSKK